MGSQLGLLRSGLSQVSCVFLCEGSRQGKAAPLPTSPGLSFLGPWETAVPCSGYLHPSPRLSLLILISMLRALSGFHLPPVKAGFSILDLSPVIMLMWFRCMVSSGAQSVAWRQGSRLGFRACGQGAGGGQAEAGDLRSGPGVS